MSYMDALKCKFSKNSCNMVGHKGKQFTQEGVADGEGCSSKQRSGVQLILQINFRLWLCRITVKINISNPL